MKIAGYSDLEEIGRGAFATVYRATQTALGRQVALKVLSGRTLDDDTRRRFDRECKAVAGLDWHPHVLHVYEAGQSTDGHPFLAMELTTLGSLADRLRRDGPIPEQEAATLVVQVADALAAAHALGVVHRDVKPGNVLIGRFGEAKLADFGIAMVSESSSATGESLSGTLGFMAPELLDGQPATPSSDLYALAATLHLMVTGQAVFQLSRDETPMSLLNRIAREAVPDPKLLDVSPAIAALITRAMAKDPAARFPSAQAFIDAAERVMVRSGWDLTPTYTPRHEGEPSPTDIASRPTTAPPSARRDPPTTPPMPLGSTAPPPQGPPPSDRRPPFLPTPSLQPPEPTYRSYVGRETPKTSAARTPGATPAGRATMGRIPPAPPAPPARKPPSASASGTIPDTRSRSAVGPTSPGPRDGSSMPRVPLATVTRGAEPVPATPVPSATGPTGGLGRHPTVPDHSDPAPSPPRPLGKLRWKWIVGIVIAILIAIVVYRAASAGEESQASVNRCPASSFGPEPADVVDVDSNRVEVDLKLSNTCRIAQRVDDPSAHITLTDQAERPVAELTFDLETHPLVVPAHDVGVLTIGVPRERLDLPANEPIRGFGWRYQMTVVDAAGERGLNSGPLDPID